MTLWALRSTCSRVSIAWCECDVTARPRHYRLTAPAYPRRALAIPQRHPRSSQAAERILVLEAGRAERNYWSDLWHYRDLFTILAWRDIAVRYKQTVIGVAWAVVRPLLALVI